MLNRSLPVFGCDFAANPNLGIQFDDDSGLVSDAFIEAVAAIVLQTALRRFLAIRKVQRLRIKAPEQTRARATPSQSPHRIFQKLAAVDPTAVKRQEQERQPKQLHFSDEVAKHVGETHPIHEFYDLAAIQIQSVFRGWWVRDSINVDH